jgi:hypothetical protein
MANRVHRPLKVIAFNANGIWRQRYGLSKQLQGLHTDVALFSETHLKPHDRFSIPNYHFYRIDHHLDRKGGTTIAVKKGMQTYLPSIHYKQQGSAYLLVIDILLAAVYKSSGCTWSDADITKFLSFRHKWHKW